MHLGGDGHGVLVVGGGVDGDGRGDVLHGVQSDSSLGNEKIFTDPK